MLQCEGQCRIWDVFLLFSSESRTHVEFGLETGTQWEVCEGRRG